MSQLDDDMQKLGERLLRAGWAAQIVDSTDSFEIVPTPQGEEKMRQLYQLLAELDLPTLTPGQLDVLRAWLLLDYGAQ